jgi:hypothetical protein
VLVDPSVPFPELREAHVDLLIVEELNCNPAFGDWLGARANIKGSCISAASSIWDGGRESDVAALFVGDVRSVLLIENKIRAPLSAGQSDHYRVRIESGCVRGLWMHGSSMIIAPGEWLDDNSDHGFDCAVDYHSIACFFREFGGDRGVWKANVLSSKTSPARHAFSMADRLSFDDDAASVMLAISGNSPEKTS